MIDLVLGLAIIIVLNLRPHRHLGRLLGHLAVVILQGLMLGVLKCLDLPVHLLGDLIVRLLLELVIVGHAQLILFPATLVLRSL